MMARIPYCNGLPFPLAIDRRVSVSLCVMWLLVEEVGDGIADT